MLSTKKTKLAIFIVTALSASSNSVYAQSNNTDTADEQTVETIEVTGTRLRVATFTEPLTVIDSEDIQNRGITDVTDLLRQITSNNTSLSESNVGGINGALIANRGNAFLNLSGGSSVNLRGLGAGSTLLLLNGRRIAGEGAANNDFIDISNIPVESIERVEVLTSGASAIYGADAVAGVVNIILKKDYSQSSFSVRHENSSANSDETRFSGTFGHSWDSGNITITGAYRDRKSVSSNDFGITTRDFRAQGGRDLRNFVSDAGVFQADPFSRDFLAPDDTFANSVLLLPANSGAIDSSSEADDLIAISRDALSDDNRVSELLPIALAPEQNELSLSVRLSQDLPFKLANEFFLDIFFTDSDTATAVQAPILTIEAIDLVESEFGIPFFDDFSDSGFREDLEFRQGLQSLVNAGILPNNAFVTDNKDISLATGLKGAFNDKWDWEFTGTYSRNRDEEFSSSFDPFDVFFGTFDQETFEPIIEPFNLLRNDFLTNTEAANAIARGSEQSFFNATTELWSLQFIGRGELWSSRDTGALQVSYGGEFRRETVDFSETLLSQAGDVVTVPSLDSFRTTEALFSEASFPITRQLTISGALRYENVENKGTTVSEEDALAEFFETGLDQFEPIDTVSEFLQDDSDVTWRLGLAYQIIDDLVARVSIGTSFRAPNASEVGLPTLAFILDDDLIDPITGEDVSFDTTAISGGNDELESETADTLNAGISYNTTFGDQSLGLSFDYYEIDYENRIASSSPLVGSSFFDTPLQEGAISRNPDGSIAFIFTRPINFTAEEQSGYDIQISHTAQLGQLIIENQINYTKTLTNNRQTSVISELENRRGLNQPINQYVFSSLLSYGNTSFNATIQRVGNFTADNSRMSSIDGVTTVDINFIWRLESDNAFSDGLTLSMGASNVFNENPAFFDGFNGFFPSFYDIRRRVVYAEIRKQF